MRKCPIDYKYLFYYEYDILIFLIRSIIFSILVLLVFLKYMYNEVMWYAQAILSDEVLCMRADIKILESVK